MADLNKSLDINNIDINDLISRFLSQKVVIANIIVVVLGLLGGYYLYNNFTHQKQAAQQNIAMLQEKLATISTYQTTKKQFDEFKNTLPKSIDEDNLVDALSNYAIQNNVEVVSFSPVTSSDSAYYTRSSVDMNVRAKDFKQLVLFIKTLESEQMVLRLENYHFGALNLKGQELSLRVSTLKVKVKS